METVAVYFGNRTEHTDTLCGQNAVYINLVRTSQETHYISSTKPIRLMLFRETVAVYCGNRTEHTDTLCGQNAEIILMLNHVPSFIIRHNTTIIKISFPSYV
jgi:hypothetical protein